MADDDKFAFKRPVSDRRWVNQMAGYPDGIKPPPRTPEQIAHTNEKLRALKAKLAEENK